MGVRVTLSEWERKVARNTAKKRFRSNRDSNVSNGKIGGQSNEFTDVNGFGGELAFCKHFNLYPDLAIEPRSGGVDATLDGCSIDVKTTEYRDGQLLAKKCKKAKDHAEVFFLITGEMPEYTLRGFAEARRLMQESNVTDLGYGPTFALRQSELRDVPDGRRVEPSNPKRDLGEVASEQQTQES